MLGVKGSAVAHLGMGGLTELGGQWPGQGGELVSQFEKAARDRPVTRGLRALSLSACEGEHEAHIFNHELSESLPGAVPTCGKLKVEDASYLEFENLCFSFLQRSVVEAEFQPLQSWEMVRIFFPQERGHLKHRAFWLYSYHYLSAWLNFTLELLNQVEYAFRHGNNRVLVYPILDLG